MVATYHVVVTKFDEMLKIEWQSLSLTHDCIHKRHILSFYAFNNWHTCFW